MQGLVHMNRPVKIGVFLLPKHTTHVYTEDSKWIKGHAHFPNLSHSHLSPSTELFSCTFNWFSRLHSCSALVYSTLTLKSSWSGASVFYPHKWIINLVPHGGDSANITVQRNYDLSQEWLIYSKKNTYRCLLDMCKTVCKVLVTKYQWKMVSSLERAQNRCIETLRSVCPVLAVAFPAQRPDWFTEWICTDRHRLRDYILLEIVDWTGLDK